MMNLNTLRVVGDRILVKPDSGTTRTSSGLFLPPTVNAKAAVKGGRVVAVGPGTPLPEPGADEPWQGSEHKPRYMPMEVEIGDYALFLQRSAIEIRYRDEEFLIVPLAGLLLVERDDRPEDPDLSDLLKED